MRTRACVSVIIVTYESRNEISECLTKLRETSSPWLQEVLVVDNASSDDTASCADGHTSRPRVIRNERNVGFGTAVNQAAAPAAGEFLLLLNPDCRVEPHAVSELVRMLDHRANAAGCGPRIVNRSGKFQHACRRGFPTPVGSTAYLLRLDRLFPRSYRLGRYAGRSLGADVECTADVLSGACMLIRRDVFAAIQGFDSDYFLFGEDIDLCWKIRQAGHELWYVPAARATHTKGASMRRAPHRARQEFYRSMRLFIDKRLRGRYSPLVVMALKGGVRVAEAMAGLRSRSR